MTTSKILVPAGINIDGTKDRVPVDIEIPQPLHVIIDGDGGGSGDEANLIDVEPIFLADYSKNLERFALLLTEADNPIGFFARGSIGDGDISFIMPLGPTWDFRLKARDASITVNESLVFTLYNDNDKVIDSHDYPIQWKDLGDGGYQADVSSIQLTEISGIEDARYVTITLVSSGSE